MGLKVKAPSSSERDEVKQNPPWKPIADWIRVLIAPGTNVEMRTIGVVRHGHKGVHAESSHYVQEGDQPERMAKSALAINHRCEGIYWTLNPLLPGPALEGRAATGSDVHSRRWLLIDCDPERVVLYGSKKVSATDDEKELARLTATKVKNSLLERGWPEPVVADSGNGYHLLYRIDLPADDNGLVKRVLQGIAAEFDSSSVKIDTSVFDPSRICKLYGTVSRKGPNSVERPHRASSLVSAPNSPKVVTIDQLEAIADPLPVLNPRGRNEDPTEQPSAPPSVADEIFKAKPKGLVAKAGRVDPVSRAEIYADRCQPAISGQNGHSQTLKVAVAVGPGFNLPEEDAFRVLWQHFNPRCEPPWTEAELQRKVREAYKVETQRGWQLKVSHKPIKEAKPTKEVKQGLKEDFDDPYKLAREILGGSHKHERSGYPILAYWAEDWLRWHDGAWRIYSPEEISAEVTGLIKEIFDEVAIKFGKSAEPVTRAVVANVLQAMKSLSLVPTWDVPKQPAWLNIESDDERNSTDYLSARNAVVHLPSLIDGQPCTTEPTPRFFSPTCLDYDFDPSSPVPENWLRFLADLWPDDPQSIACLQEWMGYLLTPDTSQGKILMMIGPKRSGKGTIARVIQGLVGTANVAAPTLSSLEQTFGLQPLIGKLIAIIGDARLSGRSDSQVIVERLLSISGQDTQTINRKNRSSWIGTLPTRFVIISNELPRLADASGALPSRMVLLRLTKSFYGKEDKELTDKLLSERSAILMWAIAGWQRLRIQGEFKQPETGKQYMENLIELSSPMLSFLAEMCEISPTATIPIGDLYKAWQEWCKTRGREHSGDEAGFGRNLHAACAEIEVSRPRKDGSRVRLYRGIRLKATPEGEAF